MSSEKYLTYQIVIIRPPGYKHSDAFQEVAITLMYGLQSLGYNAIITENTLSDSNINVILGAHLITEDQIDKIPASSIIYNLEQFDPKSMLNSTTFRMFQMFTVWDYSKRNIEKLQAKGCGDHLYYVPIGYVPELTCIEKDPIQDIDVLFYGSMNARREQIIEELKKNGLNVVSLFGIYGEERDAMIGRAKLIINIHFYDSSILEIVRIAYLLANHKAVVAECHEGTEFADDLITAVALVPYDQLVETCIELVKNDEKRQLFEKNGFECFSMRNESIILRNVLSESKPIQVQAQSVPTKINLGSITLRKQMNDLQEIVFILRRIENDIDKEENLAHIVQLLTSKTVTTKEVIHVINKDMIKKEELLHTVAASCHQQGMTDFFSAF